ncbi:hypothetical protein Tco_0173731 [Tanacetum coccineum]
MAPRAVLMKTGLKSVNTARPVNTVRSVNTGRPFSTARSFNTVRPSYTAHPKSTVHCARPRTYFQNQAQSTVHRPFYKRTALTKRCFNQRFNTGRQNVNTVRARGFNAVKPSACWVWRPIKPNGASLLPDENQILLKIPRHDNMYSFDMKNIVPKDSLTCLVAKATSEESMLWHRSLEAVFYCLLLKVQENLHIRFLENKPMIEGNGPKWLFDLDSLTQSMNYVLVVTGTFSNDLAVYTRSFWSVHLLNKNKDWHYNAMWKDASYFGNNAPRLVADAQIQDKDRVQDENDATEKSPEDSSLKDNGTADQQVNTARPEVNTGSRDVSTAVPEVNTATHEDLVGPSHASEDTQVEVQGN